MFDAATAGYSRWAVVSAVVTGVVAIVAFLRGDAFPIGALPAALVALLLVGLSFANAVFEVWRRAEAVTSKGLDLEINIADLRLSAGVTQAGTPKEELMLFVDLEIISRGSEDLLLRRLEVSELEVVGPFLRGGSTVDSQIHVSDGSSSWIIAFPSALKQGRYPLVRIRARFPLAAFSPADFAEHLEEFHSARVVVAYTFEDMNRNELRGALASAITLDDFRTSVLKGWAQADQADLIKRAKAFPWS